jgi:hypothetical protein
MPTTIDVAPYASVESPIDHNDQARLWELTTPELERRRDGPNRPDAQRLQRRLSQRNRKIKHEDLLNVLGRNAPRTSAPDLLEDEIIPGKAIVLKMPERSMKTYFIPLPIDLDVNSLSPRVNHRD